MATKSRKLYKIEAISPGDGKTRFFFARVDRTYYVDAQNISEHSRRRMERLFLRVVANQAMNPETLAFLGDLEIFFGTNGMSVGLWVHQEVSDDNS